MKLLHTILFLLGFVGILLGSGIANAGPISGPDSGIKQGSLLMYNSTNPKQVTNSVDTVDNSGNMVVNSLTSETNILTTNGVTIIDPVTQNGGLWLYGPTTTSDVGTFGANHVDLQPENDGWQYFFDFGTWTFENAYLYYGAMWIQNTSGIQILAENSSKSVTLGGFGNYPFMVNPDGSVVMATGTNYFGPTGNTWLGGSLTSPSINVGAIDISRVQVIDFTGNGMGNPGHTAPPVGNGLYVQEYSNTSPYYIVYTNTLDTVPPNDVCVWYVTADPVNGLANEMVFEQASDIGNAHPLFYFYDENVAGNAPYAGTYSSIAGPLGANQMPMIDEKGYYPCDTMNIIPMYITNGPTMNGSGFAGNGAGLINVPLAVNARSVALPYNGYLYNQRITQNFNSNKVTKIMFLGDSYAGQNFGTPFTLPNGSIYPLTAYPAPAKLIDDFYQAAFNWYALSPSTSAFGLPAIAVQTSDWGVFPNYYNINSDGDPSYFPIGGVTGFAPLVSSWFGLHNNGSQSYGPFTNANTVMVGWWQWPNGNNSLLIETNVPGGSIGTLATVSGLASAGVTNSAATNISVPTGTYTITLTTVAVNQTNMVFGATGYNSTNGIVCFLTQEGGTTPAQLVQSAPYYSNFWRAISPDFVFFIDKHIGSQSAANNVLGFSNVVNAVTNIYTTVNSCFNNGTGIGTNALWSITGTSEESTPPTLDSGAFVNRIYCQLCIASNWTYFDGHVANGIYTNIMSFDGVHPNPNGQAWLASMIEKQMGLPSGSDPAAELANAMFGGNASKTNFPTLYTNITDIGSVSIITTSTNAVLLSAANLDTQATRTGMQITFVTTSTTQLSNTNYVQVKVTPAFPYYVHWSMSPASGNNVSLVAMSSIIVSNSLSNDGFTLWSGVSAPSTSKTYSFNMVPQP